MKKLKIWDNPCNTEARVIASGDESFLKETMKSYVSDMLKYNKELYIKSNTDDSYCLGDHRYEDDTDEYFINIEIGD